MHFTTLHLAMMDNVNLHEGGLRNSRQILEYNRYYVLLCNIHMYKYCLMLYFLHFLMQTYANLWIWFMAVAPWGRYALAMCTKVKPWLGSMGDGECLGIAPLTWETCGILGTPHVFLLLRKCNLGQFSSTIWFLDCRCQGILTAFPPLPGFQVLHQKSHDFWSNAWGRRGLCYLECSWVMMKSFRPAYIVPHFCAFLVGTSTPASWG